MRNVESSTSASEAAALCDVTATTRKPATKRMSQGATQHKRGKTDGEENNTIPNAPSGCLLQALNDADDAFSPKRMRQRATHTEKRRNKQRGRITNQNVAKPLITANFANSKSLTEDARLRAFDCSSQPAAASAVESSTAASALAALYDAQAYMQAHASESDTAQKRQKKFG